jgi:hypothetical protein
VKLLYGLACQLVTIFAVLQTVRLLWVVASRNLPERPQREVKVGRPTRAGG